jgi:hypothetical protein
MLHFPARPARRALSKLLILSLTFCVVALAAFAARPAYAGPHDVPPGAAAPGAEAPPAGIVRHSGSAASQAPAPHVAPRPLDAPLAPATPQGDNSGLWLIGAGLALLLLLESVSLGLAARAGV